jgi:hypothetical protein
MRRKRKGIALFSILIFMAVLSLLLYSYVSYDDFSQAIDEKTHTRNMVIIDRFLYQWRGANAGEFPATLAEMSFIGMNIDLAGYSYVVSAARDKYRLTVSFGAGTIVSPGSNL